MRLYYLISIIFFYINHNKKYCYGFVISLSKISYKIKFFFIHLIFSFIDLLSLESVETKHKKMSIPIEKIPDAEGNIKGVSIPIFLNQISSHTHKKKIEEEGYK